MSIADAYAYLARILEYPTDKQELLQAAAVVSTVLDDHCSCGAIESFAAFIAASTQAALQEEYVATFDFNPAAAPYLGHHLYGDNQKKGGYMIRLKQEFIRYDFIPPGSELPDHLAVVLDFLAHLASQEGHDARRQFIASYVLPGLQKFNAGFAACRPSPWQSVVNAAEVLCTADSKEVAPC